MNLAEVHKLQFSWFVAKICNLDFDYEPKYEGSYSWWIEALTIKAYDPGLTLMAFLYSLALKCSQENNSYYKALQGIQEFLPTVWKLTLSANHWDSS